LQNGEGPKWDRRQVSKADAVRVYILLLSRRKCLVGTCPVLLKGVIMLMTHML
jgi:hypothetical protein